MKSDLGRPSKYRPQYCKDIIEHMKRGGSLESFGAYIGEKYGQEFAVCKDTVFEWIKVHKNFSDSVKIGIAYSRKFFEDIGNSGMVGQLKRVSSEIVRPDGSVEKKYRMAFFHERTWALNMKNRFKWTDRNEVDLHTEESEKTIVNINIPSNGREIKQSKEDKEANNARNKYRATRRTSN